MISIREALDRDIEMMIPLLEHWIERCNPDGFKLKPKPEILQQTFQHLLSAPNSTTMVMIQKDHSRDVVVGVMGVILHGWGACEELNYANESLWYIHPSCVGYTRSLFDGARSWARDNGADYFIISVNRLSGPGVEKGERMIINLGYRPLYTLFIKEVADDV